MHTGRLLLEDMDDELDTLAFPYVVDDRKPESLAYADIPVTAGGQSGSEGQTTFVAGSNGG